MPDNEAEKVRNSLLARAVRAVEGHGASAMHLFGSLARGDADTLSDVDLWVTVPDSEIARLVARRHEMFAEITEVIIFHEAPRNRPLGGAYTLVIHRVGDALIQADYYLAPESTSVVLPEALRLSGERPLPRGQWVLDASAPVVEDVHERIDFLICMSFIGVKKALRGDIDFLDFLHRERERFRATHDPRLDPIDPPNDLDSVAALLRSLLRTADDRQTAAIEAILSDIPRQARLYLESSGSASVG